MCLHYLMVILNTSGLVLTSRVAQSFNQRPRIHKTDIRKLKLCQNCLCSLARSHVIKFGECSFGGLEAYDKIGTTSPISVRWHHSQIDFQSSPEVNLSHLGRNNGRERQKGLKATCLQKLTADGASPEMTLTHFVTLNFSHHKLGQFI